MNLYYKRWCDKEIELTDDGVILDRYNSDVLKITSTYPETYCWESWILRKIDNNKEGYFDFSKNLVDIGAGLGEYCWLRFNHNYAFEPNKSTLYMLHANLVLHNKVDNTDTFQCLLSDTNEVLNYDGFKTEVGDCCNSYDTSTGREVQTKTLDEFGLDNVGLIKIDVEGLEEKVLRGGLDTIIRSNYPPILFECWDVGCFGMTQEKHDSLFNFLKDLGYEILEHWGDNETHLAVHKNQLNK